MRDDLEKDSDVRRALTIVSIVLLVSMASGLTLVRSEAATAESAPSMQSFIGTAPDANAASEPLPPQF